MAGKRTIVFGVGINDADYLTNKRINGKLVACPYYTKWHHMIRRCYSERSLAVNPTYRGCSVCENWLTFSNFKAWMETQDWHGKHLDKDFVVPGNKVYSPENCVFIDQKLNKFINSRASARGNSMIGTFYVQRLGKFRSGCKNPFTGKKEHLGCYSLEIDAHVAWKKYKHRMACMFADIQVDKRVADSLRVMFA